MNNLPPLSKRLGPFKVLGLFFVFVLTSYTCNNALPKNGALEFLLLRLFFFRFSTCLSWQQHCCGSALLFAALRHKVANFDHCHKWSCIERKLKHNAMIKKSLQFFIATDFSGCFTRLFPHKDIAVITVPHLVPEFPLIQQFVRVTPRPNANPPHELYVFHRHGLIANKFKVRPACTKDYEQVSLELCALRQYDVPFFLCVLFSCVSVVTGWPQSKGRFNRNLFPTRFFSFLLLMLQQHPSVFFADVVCNIL